MEAMRVAVVLRTAVGVLTWCVLVAVAGEATAQTQADSGPNPVAPNLKRQPEPLPPPRRMPNRAPGQDVPSATDAAPHPSHGCPDPGRKLELIV